MIFDFFRFWSKKIIFYFNKNEKNLQMKNTKNVFVQTQTKMVLVIVGACYGCTNTFNVPTEAFGSDFGCTATFLTV